MTDHRIRRCTECGAAQWLERRSVPYPQSGLDNVQLQSVPVWLCENNHEEIEVPAVTELHELLAQLIVRKPTMLKGAEIKFLRRRIGVSAKQFAERVPVDAPDEAWDIRTHRVRHVAAGLANHEWEEAEI